MKQVNNTKLMFETRERNEERVVKGKARPWSKKIKNESIGWADKPADF